MYGVPAAVHNLEAGILRRFSLSPPSSGEKSPFNPGQSTLVPRYCPESLPLMITHWHRSMLRLGCMHSPSVGRFGCHPSPFASTSDAIIDVDVVHISVGKFIVLYNKSTINAGQQSVNPKSHRGGADELFSRNSNFTASRYCSCRGLEFRDTVESLLIEYLIPRHYPRVNDRLPLSPDNDSGSPSPMLRLGSTHSPASGAIRVDSPLTSDVIIDAGGGAPDVGAQRQCRDSPKFERIPGKLIVQYLRTTLIHGGLKTISQSSRDPIAS
ncbi:hypothetical protein DFH07DRAFT_326736 [Mycena maculata]|uniref:Uncharacterized protein n=1 Tax=Mycena maculata TaxID=230809 RepID=A0AAD7KDN6_9AGAR|nr:hypothetical protein DFH07DRAFT_326736 [Mycena maculata]